MSDFEQAARAEAERRYPRWLHEDRQHAGYWAFQASASWLAEHLLSDENVEKAARGAYDRAFLHDAPEYVDRWDDLVVCNEPAAESWREVARAALKAVLGKEQS